MFRRTERSLTGCVSQVRAAVGLGGRRRLRAVPRGGLQARRPLRRRALRLRVRLPAGLRGHLLRGTRRCAASAAQDRSPPNDTNNARHTLTDRYRRVRE